MTVDISVSIILIPKDTEEVSFLMGKRKRIGYLKGRLPVIKQKFGLLNAYIYYIICINKSQ